MAGCGAQLAQTSASLQQITRATGERQDLASVFQVVLGSLEESHLSVDFGCILLHDAAARSRSPSARSARPAATTRKRSA